jgi:hypothetical protein
LASPIIHSCRDHMNAAGRYATASLATVVRGDHGRFRNAALQYHASHTIEPCFPRHVRPPVFRIMWAVAAVLLGASSWMLLTPIANPAIAPAYVGPISTAGRVTLIVLISPAVKGALTDTRLAVRGSQRHLFWSIHLDSVSSSIASAKTVAAQFDARHPAMDELRRPVFLGYATAALAPGADAALAEWLRLDVELLMRRTTLLARLRLRIGAEKGA